MSKNQTGIADALIVVAEAGIEIATAIHSVAAAIRAHGDGPTRRTPSDTAREMIAARLAAEERSAAEGEDGELWDKRPRPGAIF